MQTHLFQKCCYWLFGSFSILLKDKIRVVCPNLDFAASFVALEFGSRWAVAHLGYWKKWNKTSECYDMYFVRNVKFTRLHYVGLFSPFIFTLISDESSEADLLEATDQSYTACKSNKLDCE